MKKYIPIAKQSKKQQKEHYSSQRGSWGVISPVTRKPQEPKIYNRKKHRRPVERQDGDVFYININYDFWQY